MAVSHPRSGTGASRAPPCHRARYDRPVSADADRERGSQGSRSRRAGAVVGRGGRAAGAGPRLFRIRRTGLTGGCPVIAGGDGRGVLRRRFVGARGRASVVVFRRGFAPPCRTYRDAPCGRGSAGGALRRDGMHCRSTALRWASAGLDLWIDRSAADAGGPDDLRRSQRRRMAAGAAIGRVACPRHNARARRTGSGLPHRAGRARPRIGAGRERCGAEPGNARRGRSDDPVAFSAAGAGLAGRAARRSHGHAHARSRCHARQQRRRNAGVSAAPARSHAGTARRVDLRHCA